MGHNGAILKRALMNGAHMMPKWGMASAPGVNDDNGAGKAFVLGIEMIRPHIVVWISGYVGGSITSLGYFSVLRIGELDAPSSLWYVVCMDKTQYHLFGRRVRFRCSICGDYTVWFSVKGIARIGETVYSYSQFWSDLHMEARHKTKEDA